MLVFLDSIIHVLYFVLAGVFAIFLVKGFFKRETRKGFVYDIVYAYVILVFVMRILQIK